MKFLRSKNEREWLSFLRLSSTDELNEERWELTKTMREAKKRKIEIQREIDSRYEPPADRGQEVHV